MKLTNKAKDYLEERSELLSTAFYADVISSLEELEMNNKAIESPIEQLFFIEWNFRDMRDLPFLLCPQFQHESTGKYRIDFVIDFMIKFIERGREWLETIEKIDFPKLGIEIDSHLWHEKTKEQVQYHKERERFLIANGWKLLRFTGSEVFKDPFKCVEETLHIAFKLRSEYETKLNKLIFKEK